MGVDPLVAVWAAIKTAVWFVFGVPQVLWQKGSMSCRYLSLSQFNCEQYIAPTLAILACIPILIALIIVVSFRFKWPSPVFAVVLIGPLWVLPPLFDGLQIYMFRIEREQAVREREERLNPKPRPPSGPYRYPEVFSR